MTRPAVPVAAIVGLPGLVLADAEAVLLAANPPAGVILFARNIANPGQVRDLVAALRRSVPDVLVTIDQEGGRVARLRPPHWRAHPSAAAIGALFVRDPAAGLRAAWLTGALIGAEADALGIEVVNAPVLDVRDPLAHDVIGDRSFGSNAESVARLGHAMAEGLLAAGVQPVGKHAPGHGRARVDSHASLPDVDATETELAPDLIPFVGCADLPWLMTAHVRYAAFDPAAPATLSARLIGGVLRSRIGFKGVLVSDDLGMGALVGEPAERVRAALAAGCDLALHCSGDIDAIAAILAAAPPVSPATLARLHAARDLARARRRPLDPAVLAAEREGLPL